MKAFGTGAAASPIGAYLEDLLRRLRPEDGGAVADYIPQLGKVDPGRFAIAVATVDGQVYGVGDAAEDFTIQSVSKPFMYGYALREYPEAEVMARQGPETEVFELGGRAMLPGFVDAHAPVRMRGRASPGVSPPGLLSLLFSMVMGPQPLALRPAITAACAAARRAIGTRKGEQLT